jgi:hypothetical protein
MSVILDNSKNKLRNELGWGILVGIIGVWVEVGLSAPISINQIRNSSITFFILNIIYMIFIPKFIPDLKLRKKLLLLSIFLSIILGKYVLIPTSKKYILSMMASYDLILGGIIFIIGAIVFISVYYNKTPIWKLSDDVNKVIFLIVAGGIVIGVICIIEGTTRLYLLRNFGTIFFHEVISGTGEYCK